MYQVSVVKRLSATDINAMNEWIYTNLNIIRTKDFIWDCQNHKTVWHFRNADDAIRFKLVCG